MGRTNPYRHSFLSHERVYDKYGRLRRCLPVVHYNMVSLHNPRGSISFSQFLAITMLQLYLVARPLNESEAGVDHLSAFLMLIMLFSF